MRKCKIKTKLKKICSKYTFIMGIFKNISLVNKCF